MISRLFSVSFVRVGSQISPRRSLVGRRKIHIFPPPGEQDRSNALPQGQQRQSNPHPMPCPPAGFTLIGALIRIGEGCSEPIRFEDDQKDNDAIDLVPLIF